MRKKSLLLFTAIVLATMILLSGETKTSLSAEVLPKYDKSLHEIKNTGPACTGRRYGTNIVYLNFLSIPRNLDWSVHYPAPRDLADSLNQRHNKYRIENNKRFTEMIWAEGKKSGINPGTVASAHPLDCVKMAVDIVASGITYHLVDNDKKFIKKHGEFLPHDKYFSLGLGDCDKYASLVIAVFDIFKQHNHRLQNIYISSDHFGGEALLHAWNSVIILQKDKMILSHIDPTFHDNSGELEAQIDYHIITDGKYYQYNFYGSICGRESALFCWELLRSKFNDNSPQPRRIYRQLLQSFKRLVIYDIDRAQRELSFMRKIHRVGRYRQIEDEYFYSVFYLYAKTKNKQMAGNYLAKMKENYPRSFWTKIAESGFKIYFKK